MRPDFEPEFDPKEPASFNELEFC
jgi:hypothetical protein